MGTLLRAFHGDADGLHRVVEEQRRDVEAHAQTPLEVGDVETLVLVRVLQVAAHGHSNGDAGLDEELELQKLDADADARLQLDAGCDVQPVEDHLAAGAGHRPQVLREHLTAQGRQPDIHSLVVGFQQDFLLRAVTGQGSSADWFVVQARVVIDLHVDRAEQINVEAANGVLAAHVQGENHGAALAQAAETSLPEVGNLCAQLRVADTRQGYRYLHLNTQLHVYVGQGEEAEAVLRGKFDAQTRGQACRLEEVAVVDGVVLEHDGDLHRKADLHLGGRAVAVLGVFEAVVLPGALHEVLQIFQITAFTCAYKVRQGLHLPVCLAEALLEILGCGFLRVILRRRGGIVVLGFFAVADPALFFAEIFLLLGHPFTRLISFVVRHDGFCHDSSDFAVVLIRCDGDVCNGFTVFGRDRLVMDVIILVAC